jgi:prepilin-type N-terminal cleavage/methylation domain-containing protein/prepilin-type processing-associated H-X9-DG protein
MRRDPEDGAMIRHTRRAFTLIELLVVIAIIAVLASILFPVFTRARERAQAAACVSQLKQFGAAFFLYANDYGGRLPSPGGDATYLTAWSTDEGTTLNSYLGGGRRAARADGSIWVCPVQLARAGHKSGRFAPNSYGMNSYLRGAHLDEPYPGNFPTRAHDATNYEMGALTGQIRRPTETILLYESTYILSPDYAYGEVPRCGVIGFVRGFAQDAAHMPHSADKTYAPGPAYHAGKGNYLWCDAHVSAMSPETWREFGTEPQPTWDHNNWYAQRYR